MVPLPPQIRSCVRAFNILQCIRGAATFQKLGVYILPPFFLLPPPVLSLPYV